MTGYMVKRLLLTIPTLLAILILVFLLIRLIPGDIIKLMVAEQNYAVDEDALRRQLGIDDPVPVQFANWLGGVQPHQISGKTRSRVASQKPGMEMNPIARLRKR